MQSLTVCVAICCLTGLSVGLEGQALLKAGVALECSEADEQLGRPAGSHDERILMMPVTGTDSLYLSSVSRPKHSPPRGLMGFSGFLEASASGGAVPPLLLALSAIEKEPRTLEQRQLVFIADDTLRLEVGSMSMQAQHFPSVPGIWQTLSIQLTPDQFTAIASARKLEAMLGTTRVPVSETERVALVALWVGARCGARGGKS